MPLLKSGFDISNELLEKVSTAKASHLEWDVVQQSPHPHIEDTQKAVYPISVDGLQFPSGTIAYYLITEFEDENCRHQKLFLVEDVSANSAPRKTEHSPRERMSIPVDSKRDAEALVLEILKRFFR